jgi:hypothetical protein
MPLVGAVAMPVNDWPAAAHAAYRMDLADRQWGPADAALAALWCLMIRLIEAAQPLCADGVSLSTRDAARFAIATSLRHVERAGLPDHTARCIDQFDALARDPNPAPDCDAAADAILAMSLDMEGRGALHTCECLLDSLLHMCRRIAPYTRCAVYLRQAGVATLLGAIDRARAMYTLVMQDAMAAALPDVADVAAARLARLAT